MWSYGTKSLQYNRLFNRDCRPLIKMRWGEAVSPGGGGKGVNDPEMVAINTNTETRAHSWSLIKGYTNFGPRSYQLGPTEAWGNST